MAQLRQDYPKFQALNCEVVVLVPNGPKMIAWYTALHPTPHPILSDPGSRVAARYQQVRKFLVAGTPTVFLVDSGGKISYANYLNSLIQEPDNREPLAVLEQAFQTG